MKNKTSIVLLFSLLMLLHDSVQTNLCKTRGHHHLFNKQILDFPRLGFQHLRWTQSAQKALFEVNHPYDCTRFPILLCSTAVKKFQGTGSRLFYLGRCLAEGLNSGRAVVLTDELPSTLHILNPFLAWSNCTIEDAKINIVGKRVKLYSPMQSSSIAKSVDMPAVGALFPAQFSMRGYWWWKAQEITYALRPTNTTLEALEDRFAKHNQTERSRAVFQIRRTDKTEGCAKVYGVYRFFSSKMVFIVFFPYDR